VSYERFRSKLIARSNLSKAYEYQFKHTSRDAITPSFKAYMEENYIYYKFVEKK